LPLTWLTGLYAPAKDIVKGATSLRSRGVTLTIQAHAQGSRTWIIVTAQCRPGGKPVLVRGCWAELYETAFDACSGPQPVRTRVVNFRPGGPVTIQPGELPVRWEAQVLNEHVRRAVRELDDAATIKAYGKKHGHETLALRDRCQRDGEALRKRRPMLRVLAQLVGEPQGEKMRAVLEPIQGQSLMTRDVRIPPLAPFPERLELVGAHLAGRRSRSTDRRMKKHGKASVKS
jgi:hypothetical protein